MRRQPKVVHTWNTSMASTYWDMRLSVACAATDAEFQNRLMARDQTLNFPVMERQPHPGAVLGATAAGWTPSRRLIGHRLQNEIRNPPKRKENGPAFLKFEESPTRFLLPALCLPQVLYIRKQIKE